MPAPGRFIVGESLLGGDEVFWDSPTDGIVVSDTPVLVFTTPSRNGPLHCNIQLDKTASFDGGDLRDLSTVSSQVGWQYWDGDSWEDIPATGIPEAYTGNQARYTVQTPLSLGTWYRRVRVG